MPYIKVTIGSRNVSLRAISYPWHDREPVTNHNSKMAKEAKCRNVTIINIHRNLRYGLFRIAVQFAVFPLAYASNCAFRLLPAPLLLTAVLVPLLSWTTRPFMGIREHLSLPELVLYGTTTAVCCTADVCRWRLRLRMTRSELPFCFV